MEVPSQGVFQERFDEVELSHFQNDVKTSTPQQSADRGKLYSGLSEEFKELFLELGPVFWSITWIEILN